MILSEEHVKIRQMTVNEPRQRQAIGTMLMQETESESAQRKFESVELAVCEFAIGLYERLGYKKVDEEFTEGTIAQFNMIKSVRSTRGEE